MAYPIQWLDATFSSRSKAQELLRPDVESGLITSHDAQLAASFLPASHRYWPYIYALMGSTFSAGYVRFFRRPPAPLHRTALVATAGGFGGSVYGQFRRAKAHWAFTQALDDPVAFSQALENVNQRTGGVQPLGWTIQRAREAGPREDLHGNVPRPPEVWAQDAEQVVGADPAPVPVPVSASSETETQPQKPASRWEAIRAANARNAGQSSSWDALRQTHERGRMQESGTVNVQPGEPSSAEMDRAEAQAQFDALLEAERRIVSR